MIKPKLRFPGFEGEWVAMALNKLLFEPKIRNRNLKYEKNDVLSVSGEYGCVNQIEHLGRSYAGVSVADYHVVEFGDVVYTKSPLKSNPYGIIKCNRGKPGIVSTLYAVYRPTKLSSGEFIDYYFQLDDHLNKYLRPIVRKGAKNDMKVNNTDVLKDDIYAPSLSEQQKIADFLTEVDNKIQSLTQKKEALSRYKKGLLQKLFPKAGKTVSELRFPGFSGDWEKIPGNLLFETVSDKKHDSDLPILAISQEFGAIPRDMIDYKISVTDSSVNSYKVVNEGDFIISLRSFQGGIEYSNYRGICSPAYIILRNKVELAKVYFKYYFKTKRYIQELNKKLEGIRDGKMISYKYFSEIKIPFPSLPEQQKIADFLTTVDNKITQVEKQITNITQFKKGLLQQMFV